MMRPQFLAIALALSLPGSAFAQAEGAEAVQVKTDSEAALDLARLVVPSDLADIELRKAKEAFYAGFRSDPEMAGLEQEYPGSLDVMWNALEPIIRDYSKEAGPDLIPRLGDLYLTRLSRSEIDALVTFYSTPTGKRLIRTVYENVDYAPIVQAGLADRPATADDIGRGQQSAVAAVLGSVTEADLAVFEELGRSIPMAKVNALSAEVRQLTADWMNEPDPEIEARMEAAIMAAMEAHMEKAASPK